MAASIVDIEQIIESLMSNQFAIQEIKLNQTIAARGAKLVPSAPPPSNPGTTRSAANTGLRGVPLTVMASTHWVSGFEGITHLRSSPG